MKKSQILALIAVIILIIFLVWSNKKNDTDDKTPIQTSSIVGCYIAGTDKDVFTLNIQSAEGENVSGKLSFKNYQKDSSSGTFIGTYKNGILLGDYTFNSEGMESIMQVIFKKSGDNFIRGYGDVTAEGNHFTNINAITYDDSSSLSVFKKGECSNTQ